MLGCRALVSWPLERVRPESPISRASWGRGGPPQVQGVQVMRSGENPNPRVDDPTASVLETR